MPAAGRTVPPMRRFVALVAAGAVFAALGPAGSARAADVNHGTFGGYTYVSDSTVIPGPSAGTIEATCPAGTHAIGGGGDDGRFGFDANIHTSAPYDGADAGRAPDDGWRLRSATTATGPGTIEVFVICQPEVPSYATKSVKVAAGQGDTAKADCEAGLHVAAGGVSAGGGIASVIIGATAPFDDADANTTSDDGWRTKAGNVGNEARNVTAYAICDELNPSYKQSDPLEGGPGTASIDAPCLHPGDNILGGGLWVTGSAPETRIHASMPHDDTDPDTAANDDWDLRLAMEEEITRTVYVICA